VTSHPDAVLCILTADCAPLSFTSPEGVRGVAHAGWRGLADGVVAATADALRARGASRIEVALGPCIHPECYEFSPVDLDEVARRLGDHVRAETADGRPALDLPGAVRVAVADAGAVLVEDARSCTACAIDADGRPRWFSHRARQEAERQALVQWT
jgi:copper oxidase (laccase) domain-containing protein